MNGNKSIINVNEIRDIFKENCEEENRKFTEQEFQKFLECCERDFYQWLKDNLKYFSSSRQ
ncbi:MAG: hypothetical protein HF967_06370 [Methanosarcinales archaeon]|nr:hypothetical protein [Methanosarcinales archaeon]